MADRLPRHGANPQGEALSPICPFVTRDKTAGQAIVTGDKTIKAIVTGDKADRRLTCTA
jgi:hypothetical protein